IGVTVQNVTISGEKGHASFLTRRSFGVLVKDCIDESGTWHGPGTGYAGVNTVYVRCEMQADQSLDAHSGQPYATLIDDVDGGVFNRNGGPHESFPHHGKDYLFWNFRHNSSEDMSYNFWPDNRNGNTFADPLFVGFQANKQVEFSNEGLNQLSEQTVEPRSLFDAQLGLRIEREQAFPFVSFDAPGYYDQVPKTGLVKISASAGDPDGVIANVALYLNDQLVRSVMEEPFTWGEDEATDPLLNNLGGGSHELKVVAMDNDGNTTVSLIVVTAGISPTVQIVRPEATKIIEVGDDLEVEVIASDQDGTIATVSLYIDEQLVGVLTEEPFLWNSISNDLLENLEAGNHTLEVITVDDDGLSSTDVQNIFVNRVPSIVFSSPAVNEVVPFGGNIRVNVGASDQDGNITRVKLYLNDDFLREDNSVPYTWGFDEDKDPELFNMEGGDYWLRAEATDDRGSKTLDSTKVSVEFKPLSVSHDSEKELNYYPNPFIDKLSITYNNRPDQIRLSDVTGRSVSFEHRNASENTIEISGLDKLAPGVYYLKLQIEQSLQVFRVLKQE
ncbi:MAG: DUF4955 domain-containing protein, partial [Cyclobacteriaceae bacterium]